MNQNEQKIQVAQAASSLILQEISTGAVLGIGTGSTVNAFIEALTPHARHFRGVVSSSQATTLLLQARGFQVLDVDKVETLVAYVDGADEINFQGQMIKGGGGALTREKIVAGLSDTFICICDASKQVKDLGKFPLPIEVIPWASSSVRQVLRNRWGAQVQVRVSKLDPAQAFVTDNGGWILDVQGLQFDQACDLEMALNQLPGTICNGLFALQPANILLLSSPSGVTLTRY